MEKKKQNPHGGASTVSKSPQHSCFLLLLSIIFTASVSSSADVSDVSVFDYADALSKSLLYFESQRSGRLPYNQRVAWRDHSGLTDGLEQGVDLVGGYYDAGDHVKFGLPMAFTVTMLSWGVIEYGDQIVSAGEFEHALEAIKWGTDYFIKSHTSPNVLWAEVGDGDTDHYCWQRPEDMTTSRHAYKIDENNPGSDLAGETAAAMAAASIVFRKANPHYSHLLLHHAQQLFDFGDKYRGRYDASVDVVKSYYASVSGYMDELLWGAMWLYKATDNDKYLNYVIQNADSFGGIGWAITEFSWDVKYAGLQIMASKLLIEEKHNQHRHILEQYRSKAEHYLCSCLNKNNNSNVDRTPAGLLYVRQWNNMQYVSTAAFLLTVYSDFLRSSNQNLHCNGEGAAAVDHQEILNFARSQVEYILGSNPMNTSYLVGYGSKYPNWVHHRGASIVSYTIRNGEGAAAVDHQEILNFARSQVEYILGSNPMNTSYLVGFGSKYPNRVHHRGASIVSYRENKAFIGCTQGYDNWYSREDPNPNVVVGALVGGPDCQDNFMDQRDNYMQTEACTYNTAPLVGVFAKLLQLEEESKSLIASY